MADLVREPATKRRWWKRALKILLWTLAGVVALLVLVVLFLHTGAGQELLRRKIEARIGERLNGGSVVVDRLHFKLGGRLELGGVKLSDAAGKPVIELDSLTIEPSWGELVGGEISINRIALDGLRLNIEQDAEGGSNLKRLFKEEPVKPGAKKAPEKKRHIVVREITLRNIGVTLKKPDGSELRVSDVGVDAQVDAIPSEKTVSAAVTRLGLGLRRTTAEGAVIVLDGLETTIDAKLVRGEGKLAVGPVKAHARIERPGVEPFAHDIALGGIELDVKPGELGATLKKLEAGLLLLDSLEVRGGAEGQELRGDQRATLIGLHVDREKLNALIGKDLVLTDIDIASKIAGPPSALALHTDLKSAGLKLDLDGTVDVSRLEDPAYDLKLVGKELATAKLLKSEKLPPIESERLELGLKGHGVKKERLNADIRLELGPTTIRKVRIDSLTLVGHIENGLLTIKELVIDGLSQHITGAGTYDLNTKELHAKVELAGDIGKAIAAVKRAGVPVKSEIPPGAVVLSRDRFRLEVDGKLDQGLTVKLPASEIQVAGGRVTIDGDLALVRGEPDPEGKRALGLDTVHTDVKLSGIRLSSLAKLRGKRLEGMDGTVSGTINVRGKKSDPQAKIALDVATYRTDDTSRPGVRAQIRGDAGKHRVNLGVTLYKTRGKETLDPIAMIDAKLPVTTEGKKGLAPGRELDVKIELPRRALRDVVELLPPAVREKIKLPPDAQIEAHGELGGTSDQPKGQIRIDATTRVLGLLSGKTQRVTLEAKIEPDGKSSNVEAKLRGSLDDKGDPNIAADASAKFSHSPLVAGAPQEVDWTLKFKVGPQKLEDLPRLIVPPGLSGTVGLAADFHGNRHDAAGTLALDVASFKKEDKGPFDAKLRAELTPEKTNIDLDARAVGLDALKGKIGIDLAGRGVLDKAREKKLGDPALQGELELVRHPLSDWARLRPKLENYAGSVGGTIHLAGTLKQPLANGEIALRDIDSMNGRPATASVKLDASAETVGAQIALGEVDDQQPLAIIANVSRPELLLFLGSKEGKAGLDVNVSARAKQKPLGSLVPKITKDFPEIGAKGRFDWDMQGKLRLESEDGKRHLADASLDGGLSILDGTIPIPSSKRNYHSVELRLTASREALRIDRIHLEESDREKKNRVFDAHGRVDWHNLKPERAELALNTKDFLIYGSDTLGKPDAPRSSLTAKIDVVSDLSKPRRKVDVTVRELDLSAPERFEKAHWPEVSSLGDVIYLDEKKAPIGKFVVPESKKKKSEPPPSTPPDPNGGTDLFVHIPKPIRVQKQPFELVAHGELAVKIRPGTKPAVTGELDVVDGQMSLGGRAHTVMKDKKSRIYFDATHPAGELDLWVHRVPNPIALQDISAASAEGDDVRLHLTGPISKPISTVNGVGNADLWDLLPVENAGRVKYTSQPDMPPSMTAQVPREYDVILISYMVANLPHNAFLDRVNAWADPYDDRFSYGKIRHFEGERYSKDGKTRIRATSRPPTMGQSNAELEADYLLHNGKRTKAGAGLTAGSRAGGGPSLFFEWSSED